MPGMMNPASCHAKSRGYLYQISEQVKLNESRVGIAYNVDDLIYLKNAGKKAIFLAIENGYAIGKDLNNLSMFKDMGITYITLCHNGSNDICDSAKGEPEHDGLSPFGREVVKEMNRLGIIIDISHTSAKTVQDVLELSTAPSSHPTLPHGLYATTQETSRMIRSKGNRGQRWSGAGMPL